MKMIVILLMAAGAQCDRDTGPYVPAPAEYHQCVNNGRDVWDGCE